MFMNLWTDERGSVVTTEMVVIATVMSLGLVAGMTTMRDAAVSELTDLAEAISSLNQSYYVPGVRHGSAYTAGSQYEDDSGQTEPMKSQLFIHPQPRPTNQRVLEI